MSSTFLAGDAVEIAVVERSGFIESRHLGSAVVVASDGEPLLSVGDPAAPVFTRSCLKPLQALAILRAGVPLAGAQVVLASASHSGQQQHTDVVRSMLDGAGLSEDDLRCPADLPGNKAARREVLAAGGGPRKLYFNCSGKHAGFLWACRLNGWDIETYLEPEHPMQRLVAEVVEEYTGEPPAAIGVDGCGAPVFATSLTALARGISKIAAAPLFLRSRETKNMAADARAATIAQAIDDYPWAIAGDGEPNTIVIEDLGILAKLGAEGMLVLATPAGIAVAVKCLDGAHRATTLAGLTLLAEAGGIDRDKAAAVLEKLEIPVLGGGEKVGRVRVGEGISALALAGR
ncbi:asparaginase [Saxibacter everestensis]|uniref:Asparaginase n=1 Tax=Saxibacter everestensis TaxID=2909229 RepID=A0ABY8QTX6_9MICO|nr:asparaginase [Brevibacteriaceae bacterium ZFBP1038]